MQGIGPYDYFAIDWGYRRIPNAASPDAERPVLDSLARSQDAQPWDRWIGDGDPVDPRIITEALGDDPVKASGYGVRNIKRLVPMLIPPPPATGSTTTTGSTTCTPSSSASGRGK